MQSLADLRQRIEALAVEIPFLASRNSWVRQELVNSLDAMVCDPLLPPAAAGHLLDLSDNTVRKYRRSAKR